MSGEMSRRRHGVDEVHVIVPAHNEAELIGACLTSITEAARLLTEQCGTPVSVRVVADRCTDATAEIVAEHAGLCPPGVEVAALTVEAGCVGRARHLGVRHLLDATGAHPHPTWIASTDADSTVGPAWLVGHVAAACSGYDLRVGAVRPDPGSLSARVLQAWEARHRGPDQLHIHGANLGIRASTYQRAGGFPPLAEHEDVVLVRTAIAAGAHWVAGTADVHTSGRTTGRTPGGFAGYLRTLSAGTDHVGPVETTEVG